MPASFFLFLTQAAEDPALALSALLTLGVLLVNGWTDAPNAIAGAVVTGALSLPPGGAPGGGVQLFRGVLRHGGTRVGGGDHLLHRRLPGRAGGGLPGLVRRHGGRWCSGRLRPGGGASPPVRATPWWRASPERRRLWRGTSPASAGRNGAWCCWDWSCPPPWAFWRGAGRRGPSGPGGGPAGPTGPSRSRGRRGPPSSMGPRTGRNF